MDPKGKNASANWIGGVWCAVWLFLNISTTIVNKSIFTFLYFPFPVFVSCIHMIVSLLMSIAFIKIFKYPTKSLNLQQQLRVAAFSLLFCLNIVFGNVGINYTSVSMSQVIRSSIPGFTMVLSYYILGKRYSMNQILTILLVIVGVALATFGDLEITVIGFVITVVGCVLSSTKSIVTSIFLVGELKFHPIELLARMAAFAIPQMLIQAYFVGEFHHMANILVLSAENLEVLARESPETHFVQVEWGLILSLLVNGAMAFFLNFSNFMFTRSTSPLTVTVAGSVKNVLTIIIAIVVFHTEVTALNALGTIITIFAASLYNYINYKRA